MAIQPDQRVAVGAMTRGHARVLKPLDWLGIAATYCSRLELLAGRSSTPRLRDAPEEKVEVAIERASAIGSRVTARRLPASQRVAKPCIGHQPASPTSVAGAAAPIVVAVA